MKILTLQNAVWVCFILLTGILCVVGNPVLADEKLEDTEVFDTGLNELLTSVYCYCGCVRETIQACVCGVAKNIETDFRNRLLEGDSVDLIRTDYLEKWGSEFSAVMPAKGVNLIAYIMPAVILLALGGVILFIRVKSSGNKVVRTLPDKQISDKLQQKLESELEEYKKQN
ncbi:cytochrome c-type biogenesis protein CcmH [Candidatus Poribacteria bacterium]|nr:cytochrome c-type biogenesis protein CcmH [Candidatus Poribacteria bacterium]